MDPDLDDRDVKLVTRATKVAVQDIALKNRHRLMWTGLLVGIIVGGIIGGLVGGYVSAEHGQETRDLARANSLANCQVQATVRPQGNARAFDQLAFLKLLQDALLPRKEQNPRATAFARMELREFNALADGAKGPRWRSYTVRVNADGKVVGNELPGHITGFDQLAATIHPVPLIDCRKLLTRR